MVEACERCGSHKLLLRADYGRTCSECGFVWKAMIIDDPERLKKYYKEGRVEGAVFKMPHWYISDTDRAYKNGFEDGRTSGWVEALIVWTSLLAVAAALLVLSDCQDWGV